MSRDFVPLTEKELERVAAVVNESSLNFVENVDNSDNGWLKNTLTGGKVIEASEDAYFGNLATLMYTALLDDTHDDEDAIYETVYSSMRSIGREDEIDQMLW